MELIKKENVSGRIIERYELANSVDMSDAPKIVDLLTSNNIRITSLSITDSSDDMDYFSKSYNDIKQFKFECDKINAYIDKFSVRCKYNNNIFSISFEIGSGDLVTTRTGDINLEPLLQGIENICQKKSNTKSH